MSGIYTSKAKAIAATGKTEADFQTLPYGHEFYRDMLVCFTEPDGWDRRDHDHITIRPVTLDGSVA